MATIIHQRITKLSRITAVKNAVMVTLVENVILGFVLKKYCNDRNARVFYSVAAKIYQP